MSDNEEIDPFERGDAALLDVSSDDLIRVLRGLSGSYRPNGLELFWRLLFVAFIAAVGVWLAAVSVTQLLAPEESADLFLPLIAAGNFWLTYLSLRALKIYAEFADDRLIIHGRPKGVVNEVLLGAVTSADIYRDRHSNYFLRLSAQDKHLEYPLDQRLKRAIRWGFTGRPKVH
ncbi:MAG: hypothetical protein AAF351_05485 [Pseudomonadota bacterium]